jgi:hypothetical protein
MLFLVTVYYTQPIRTLNKKSVMNMPIANLDQDSPGEWDGNEYNGWRFCKYEGPGPNGWEEVDPDKLARANNMVKVGGDVRRGDKVIIHTLNPHTGSSDERAAALGKLKHKLDVGDLATVCSRKKNGWLRVKIHRTEAVITIRNVTSCSRVLSG